MRVDDVAGNICQALCTGMASILPPPLADADFAPLARFEARPGDLEQCVGSDGEPVKLGKGGFGEVFKATLYGHHGFVAVKRVRADRVSPDMLAEFKKEVLALFSLRHKHVVEALGFSSRPDDLFLAMEFMSGGSLCDALHEPKDGDASWLRWDAAGKRVLEHVAAGLFYLHTRRPPLIHRDVKSANVLLSAVGDPNVTAKITDLGSLKEKMRTYVSVQGWGYTPVYAPPEVLLRRKKKDPKQDEKVDVFAWGVLMWEVMSGTFPHMDYLEPPAGAPANAVRLHERCVREEPKERPTSAELLGLLDNLGDVEEHADANALLAERQRREAGEAAAREAAVAREGAAIREAAARAAEEAERKKREAEKAERKKSKAEEADRKRRVAEKAEEKRREAEEADRQRRLSAESDVKALCVWRAQCPELRAMWDESGPVTAWRGVTFGEAGGAHAGRVVKILLMGKGLTGDVPAALGGLTALTQLDLDMNRLTSVPEELGGLTALTELVLSENRLTSVPEELGRLTALTTLDLDGNRLTSVPEELLPVVNQIRNI